MVFGVIQRDEVRALKDLNPREILIFSPLVVLVLLMGVYPKPFLDVMRPSTTELVQQHCAAMEVANVDWRSCLNLAWKRLVAKTSMPRIITLTATKRAIKALGAQS